MVNHVLAEIYDAPLQTVRTKDLSQYYRNPSKELSRLARDSRVVRLAHGVYMGVPPQFIGLPWFPPSHLAAIAWATAVYGEGIPILSGVGAARFHHAIPREISVCEVSVPVPRRDLVLDNGTAVRFSSRGYSEKLSITAKTDLGSFRITTRQQTLEDLLYQLDHNSGFTESLRSDISVAAKFLSQPSSISDGSS